ncbi:MAG: hypothetical protein Q9168_002376 [Polycauliona sp. 1 TL-2023]
MEYAAGPASPTSPPFSPITPVMSNEFPPPDSQTQPTSQPMENPLLKPISESDNTDAIALRAAISVLLLQRQQAHRDITTLQRQKKQAMADPAAFTEALETRQIKMKPTGPLHSETSFKLPPFSMRDEQESSGTESDTETRKSQPSSKSDFGDIPGSQEVVRCPPINWAKYHVLGEPLDSLHEEQRRRPVDGQRVGEGQTRGEEHVIAAPYDPFKDKLAPKSKRPAPGSGDRYG